jgi:hypothetical protein
MRLGDADKYQVLVLVAAVGLAAATRWSLRRGWEMRTGEDPPDNPADAGASWPTALAWGALSGATAGMARVIGRRAASGVRLLG